MMVSVLTVSEPVQLIVRTFPDTTAETPSDPVEPAVLGVPLKATPGSGATARLSLIVIVTEPAAFASGAALRSTRVKVTVPVDVVPWANVPTEVPVALAETGAATMAVKREASNAALMPTLSAFLNLFKSYTSCVWAWLIAPRARPRFRIGPSAPSLLRSGYSFLCCLPGNPERQDAPSAPRCYGDGVGSPDGGGVRRGFSVGDGWGVGVGKGSAVALGDGSVEGVGEALASGVALGSGVGLAEGSGVGAGSTDAVGCLA